MCADESPPAPLSHSGHFNLDMAIVSPVFLCSAKDKPLTTLVPSSGKEVYSSTER